MNHTNSMNQVVFSFFGLLLAGTAVAGEATWIESQKTGSWSVADNWKNGILPTTDGTDTVVIPKVDGSVAERNIDVDQNAYVHGIMAYQNDNASPMLTFAASGNPASTLSIGAGGYSSVPKAGATAGERPLRFSAPLYLSASQVWQPSNIGLNNLDWFCYVNGDVSSPVGVKWVLAGMGSGSACKYSFNTMSSANFLGETYLQAQAVLNGTDQFNRLGATVVFCNTNCLGATSVSDTMALNFYHKSSGTGFVNTAFVFDMTNGANRTVALGIPTSTPEIKTETVFRGKWSGHMRGYGSGTAFYINACGNTYGYGFGAGNGGPVRVHDCVVRLENDMSDLTVWPFTLNEGRGSIDLENAVYVLASEKAVGGSEGPKTWKSAGMKVFAPFNMGGSRPGRLQGFLTTDGINVNANNDDGFAPVSDPGINGGATSLVGLYGQGYAEFGSMRLPACDTTSGAEQPCWFFAEPGGTARFKGQLTYSGSNSRFLPIQIWGGGTVIMAHSYYCNSAQPIFVRDGHMVVEKTSAVRTWDLTVGVRHPKTFKVRVLQFGYLNGLLSTTFKDFQSNPQTVAFKTAPVVDGVTVAAGDIVLVNCPDGNDTVLGSCYNGIWVVGDDLVTWTRHADFNEATEMVPDTGVTVEEGMKYAGTRWFLNHDSFRVRERMGSAHTMTMCAHDYTPIFVEEVHPEPEVALLLSAALNNFTNNIEVVDNQSEGDSILGAYGAGIDPVFAGRITVTKPTLTLSAPATSSCSLTGSLSGTFGLKKTGAGDVIVNPSVPDFSVTNLVMVNGRLSLSAANLASDIKSVELGYTEGGNANLELEGDIDLTGWTLDVTGLYKPEKGVVPAAYMFTLTSKDGSVTGNPTVTMNGTSTKNWHVSRSGNVWTVKYVRPGLCVVVR